MDEKRNLLRHTLATLAYRVTRALENAPINFGDFSAAGRRPVDILAHIGDLLVWAHNTAQGDPSWKSTRPLPWPQECARFFAALAAFDALLASHTPLMAPMENLFQGPIADAFTHTGQLAMLRRLSGSPVRTENFYGAAITVGQVGSVQPAPVKSF